MSDLLFEYKVRARHRLGWKEFTFYATTDIEEFLNRNSIDYVRNATDTVENRLFKENKRLNNIINELEKDLIEYFKKEYPNRKLEDYNLENCTYDYALVILGRLQELKGSDKE